METLFLSTDAAPLSPVDALRLLMVYMVTHEGLTNDTRRRLTEMAGIGPEDQVSLNL